MNEDHRKLLRRLVATVTALIETAHEAARRLEPAARDIAALAESTTVIAGPVKDGARAGSKSPC